MNAKEIIDKASRRTRKVTPVWIDERLYWRLNELNDRTVNSNGGHSDPDFLVNDLIEAFLEEVEQSEVHPQATLESKINLTQKE